MSRKIHPEICKHCNIHFVIDKECGGDYHPAVGLQWWCPDCGQMKPFIEVPALSKRKKNNLSLEFARKYNLPFEECQTLAKKIEADDENEFFRILRTLTLNHACRGHESEVKKWTQ